MRFIDKLAERFGGGTRYANSVTPPNSRQAESRLREIARVTGRLRQEQLEETNPGQRLAGGVTADHYGRGETVSFEQAAGTEHKLKGILDDDVEAENRGLFPLKRGLPPCKRRDHNT